MRTAFKQWGTEVGVVDDLIGTLVVGEVSQFVMHVERALAWYDADAGPGFEVAEFEGLLLDQALDRDAVRRLGFDADDDSRRRDVLRAAVQRVGAAVFGARVSGPFEAAAREHFVEAVEPTQPAALGEVDEGRMDDFFDGRLPPERHVTRNGIEQAHAARRYDHQLQVAGIDRHQRAAFLPAAVQRRLADREWRGDAERLVADLPVLDLDALRDVGQYEVVCSCCGGYDCGHAACYCTHLISLNRKLQSRDLRPGGPQKTARSLAADAAPHKAATQCTMRLSSPARQPSLPAPWLLPASTTCTRSNRRARSSSLR